MQLPKAPSGALSNEKAGHSPESPHAYIGRFAPSPTGPLHFGSLVAAVASYLHARSNKGQWLVRMEDLDPPREQPGAASAILRCLESHGLHWDGSLLYQSQRLEIYQQALDQLTAADLVYRCNCTRQDLQVMGGIYSGRCRQRAVDANEPHASRLKLYDTPCQANEQVNFADLFQGGQQQNLRLEAGDPILKRKDGLFAYQLAVVVDDIAQGITHIIRGMDLLDVTARQIVLFKLLGAPAPAFGHVPLVLNDRGQKLSKQNLAPSLDNNAAANNLWRALMFLRQNPPAGLARATITDLLAWGTTNWDSTHLISATYHWPQGSPDE